jgi:hypothetical protein
MPKIGKDVLEKKASAIISSPKESEEFEEWRAQQQEEREEKPKSEVELKSKMPDEVPEAQGPTLEDYEEMAKLKAQGKLKVAPEEEEE